MGFNVTEKAKHYIKNAHHFPYLPVLILFLLGRKTNPTGEGILKIHIDVLQHLLQARNLHLTKPLIPAVNYYSLEQFKLRLAIEKRRSERTDNKSSIIFMNVKSLMDNGTNNSAFGIHDIVKIICDNIRVTDVVTIYRTPFVLILLVDADCVGAQYACRRLVHKMMEHFASSFRLRQKDFHIKILSFPERKVDSTKLESTPVTRVTSGRLRRYSDVKQDYRIRFKKEYVKNLSLCISSFNGSVIAMRMEEIYFWDQDLLSTYIIGWQKATKKMMDLVGAITALSLLLPLMGLIAIGVKISSPGPVLFKQKRVGYKGELFTFLKFRSMFMGTQDNLHQDYVRKLIHGENEQINMGSDKDPCYKLKNDARITPFGRILRKTSLDELPQFFNVLKGEMSLVGPRPPIPYEVNEYKNWHYRRILNVKPGITGLWQVSGRNRTSFDEMVRLDIKYAENWTLKMDFKIILKTILVVFSADGE